KQVIVSAANSDATLRRWTATGLLMRANMVRMKKTKQTPVPAGRKSKSLPYKNAALPVARRVKDLLSRMTLEEKAAQMLCVWQKKPETLVDSEGNFDLQMAKASFNYRLGLGQVGRPRDSGKGKNSRCIAELPNA